MGKYLDKIRQHEGTQPIETVKAEEALKQQKALDPSPTIQPGDRIEWERAGTAQQGLVDFLHCDADGTMWAFCTVAGGSWTAVNMKFAKGSGHD
jgi:hypothetical protein